MCIGNTNDADAKATQETQEVKQHTTTKAGLSPSMEEMTDELHERKQETQGVMQHTTMKAGPSPIAGEQPDELHEKKPEEVRVEEASNSQSETAMVQVDRFLGDLRKALWLPEGASLRSLMNEVMRLRGGDHILGMIEGILGDKISFDQSAKLEMADQVIAILRVPEKKAVQTGDAEEAAGPSDSWKEGLATSLKSDRDEEASAAGVETEKPKKKVVKKPKKGGKKKTPKKVGGNKVKKPAKKKATKKKAAQKKKPGGKKAS